MGTSEAEASAKNPKASSASEQPPVATSVAAPVTPVYPDWSSFQAYSPIPPHGFFHSPVASSPQAHPYMWGAQHLMPPYGTPPHPYVMYPPGVYAHPSMPPGSHPFNPYTMASPNGNPEASGAPGGGVEVDGKSSEGKERSPLKRSKGSLGSLNMITGKNKNEPGKTTGQPANGVYSQSGESGSDSSSEGSDANSQNDSQPNSGGGHDSFDENCKSGNAGGVSQNGLTKIPSQATFSQTMALMSLPTAAAPGVAGPATNLNIGMDYWSAANPSAVAPVRGKIPATAVGGAVVPGAPSELWLQDERELKRQKRKQSNRESARRSRLRKQAECEELAQRAETMKEENASLRAELNRIRAEYEELVSQNTSLKEKLEGHSGASLSLETPDKHYGDSKTKENLDSEAAAGKSNPV